MPAASEKRPASKFYAFKTDQQKSGVPMLEGFSDLLTTANLSEISGQCESTIRRLCASGELPAVRIGRRWYVPKARFLEMMGC